MYSLLVKSRFPEWQHFASIHGVLSIYRGIKNGFIINVSSCEMCFPNVVYCLFLLSVNKDFYVSVKQKKKVACNGHLEVKEEIEKVSKLTRAKHSYNGDISRRN
jgi:hypothetical protein